MKLFNASQLKYLAVVLMFFDHIHQMFYDKGAPDWLVWSGRLVFPIFMFLAADSFFYTRDRKLYMKRLFLGYIFMNIVSMFIQDIFPNPNVVLMNNAFGTFFVSGLFIIGWDKIKENWVSKNRKQLLLGILIFISPLLLSIPMFVLMPLLNNPAMPMANIRYLFLLISFFPNIVMVEGGTFMALLGFIFYLFREKRLYQILALILLSVVILTTTGFENVQWMMIFAVIPMMMYNGEKGNENKWFFYIFYPAHIYLLYIIATVLF